MVTEANIDTATSINAYAFYGCTSITSVTIGNQVTSIGDYAFQDCSSLTSITIGEGVTSIGDYAFYGCESLTSVTIPDSVTSIGSSAFSECSSLESIIVDEGNTVYHSDGNCLIETERKTLIAGCKTSIIPSDGSVTIIRFYAFEGCSSLTSITIPDSVTSIGHSAFNGCSSLTSVTIESNYAYANAGTEYNQCGYLLENATEVRVLISCIEEGSTNSYLEDTATFTKTTSEDGFYYIYTKI